MIDSERQQVLKMIEDGKISPEQGLALMQALEELPVAESVEPALQVEPAPAPSAAQEPVSTPRAEPLTRVEERSNPEFDHKLKQFRGLWVIPLWAGIGLTVLGAWWMFAALQSSGMGFWFFLACLPFLIGVLLTVLAFSSRVSRWIYINVQQRPGESPQHIVMAFPLTLATWVLQLVRFSPGLRENGAGEDILRAVAESTRSGEPLFVDVNEAGEHVQVYIG